MHMDQARRELLQELRRKNRMPPLEETPSKLDTHEPPITREEANELIAAQIAAHDEHIKALLVEILAKMLDSNSADLELSVRKLSVELSEVRAAFAEFRATLASEKSGAPVDLPRVPLRPRELN
jgi:hypothetical protein